MDGKNKDNELIEILKLFSPGTSIRTALDDLLRARMGALIVIDKDNLINIVDGGFRVNSKFSSQRLVELAKMDGAIILSSDLKKILYANTLLFPDVRLSTKETGTRHKAAERTAKQMKTIVIAVSERKNKITLYFEDIKYELEGSSEILRRATETLQILEKQKEMLDDLLINLNVLEINNIATISDICGILQRIEIINRISDTVKRYLVELGKEGFIISMRLKELTRNLNQERRMILEDYFDSRLSKVDLILSNMNFDVMLDTTNLLKELFGEIHDKSISPSGLRILRKINLNGENLEILINNFESLDNIFSVKKEDLIKIFKDENFAGSIKHDLDSLREKIMGGKKV
ncbi:MAG: DNA integrity scanning diadenylate cyclase DisA [archaeon]